MHKMFLQNIKTIGALVNIKMIYDLNNNFDCSYRYQKKTYCLFLFLEFLRKRKKFFVPNVIDIFFDIIFTENNVYY